MQERVTYLLNKKIHQELSTVEAEELLAILQQPEHELMVTNILSDMVLSEPQGPELDAEFVRGRVHQIVSLDKNGARSSRPVYFLKRPWVRYAAAIILLFGIGSGVYIYSLRTEQPIALQPATAPAQPDVAPGGNIATLTLSDGSRIALDSAADGSLARQGNTYVVKLQKGQLAYKSGSKAGEAILYNTVSTPRGGQYQVVLPDGSKVWLNASSSLRFPTAFKGGSREVEIMGEAYFEIGKIVNMPFYVKANGMVVEVLGTKFNLNAYSDEPVVRTTLLEGSVRVKKDKTVALLAPGQQASFSINGKIDINKDADVEEAVAWKNGLFRLTKADIPTIMRQLTRWYDVEVEFEGGVPTGHITGEVPRNTSLSKVLRVFETSGVHFRIDGNKIVVTQ